MLNIVEVPDPSEFAQFPEMGLLSPVPGIEKNAIVVEDRDGSNVQRLTASKVIFKVGAQTKFKDRKVKIDLFVTDARFALDCSSYDKGGGHVFFGGGGALLVGVGANSVSKSAPRCALGAGCSSVRFATRGCAVSAARRRPGSARHEKLYFETSVKGGGTTTLTLYLPSNVSAAQVAAEVARRAARYRLATKNPDGELRLTLEALTPSRPLMVAPTPRRSTGTPCRVRTPSMKRLPD